VATETAVFSVELPPTLPAAEAAQRAIAKTDAPRPTLPAVVDETAGASPASSAQSVQRGIAAAEASSPSPSVAEEEAPPAVRPAVEASLAAPSAGVAEAAQRAIAAAEASPSSAPVAGHSAPSTSPMDAPAARAEPLSPEMQALDRKAETAVSAVPMAPDEARVQRAIAAVETPPARAAAPPPIIQLKSGAHVVTPPTSVSDPQSAPPAPVVAEMDTQPALPLPGKRPSGPVEAAPEPPAQDAIQRAITAVESSPTGSRSGSLLRVQARPANRPEPGVSSGRGTAVAQTAVAPNLATSQSPAVVQPAPAVLPTSGPASATLLQSDRVQRVVAVAEAPPALQRASLALSEPVWQRPAAVTGQEGKAEQTSTPPPGALAGQPAASFASPSVSAVAAHAQPQVEGRPDPEVSPAAPARVQPVMIQRAITDEDKVTTSDSTPTTLQEPEAEAATAVDVDELARQVYQQLRRRLIIERERERGRL